MNFNFNKLLLLLNSKAVFVPNFSRNIKINIVVILLIVLYGCETWAVTLRK